MGSRNSLHISVFRASSRVQIFHLLYQPGHEDIAVHDASMNEWAGDDSLPMEVG
ncbi:MAG: hypothetical protein ING02_00020 [Roseomonas sp.]|nr:hypothetical protein [Roseomonas sp.]